jgi:hypothetical protein
MKNHFIVTALIIFFVSLNLSAQVMDKTPDKVSKKVKSAKDKSAFTQEGTKDNAKYDIKCKPQEKVMKAYDCLGSDGKIAKHCVIIKGKGYVGNDVNSCKSDMQSKYSCNDFTLCAKKAETAHPTK